MIGKLIGAAIGSQAAKQTTALGGTGGAALGFIAPAILRRMSIPGMLAIATGGYFVKKYMDEKKAETPALPAPAEMKTVSAKPKPMQMSSIN